MSEKQLREGAVTKALDQTSYVCVHCLAWSNDPDWLEHEDDCPMRKDPDLVGLLRKLKRTVKSIPGNTPSDRLWVSAIESVILRIEKTVRLIDEPPGWKWINEQKEAR